MKTYRRDSDGFEINDPLDRDLVWVISTYGEGFSEVIPIGPTDAENIAGCRKVIGDFAKVKYVAGFSYGGFTYQIDTTSRTEIGLRAVYATNSTIDPVNFPWTYPYDRGWRDIANMYQPMTASEFLAFAKAVSDYCSCIKCCCDDHKDAVTALNYATYDYSTGWPV